LRAMGNGNSPLRFTAAGAVLLSSAKIEGELDCSGAAFENPCTSQDSDRVAFNAERASVGGPVALRPWVGDGKVLSPFTAKGGVRLAQAEIGGDLDCTGGTFECPDGDAIHAERVSVKGPVLMRSWVTEGVVLSSFIAKGVVRLFAADIGSFECDGATFQNPRGEAINAHLIQVKGPVFLRAMGNGNSPLRFTAAGAVLLSSAKIEGELDCTGGQFNGFLSLEGASVQALRDDVKSWPSQGLLELDGFAYQRFGGEAPTAAALRLEWLHRQSALRMPFLKRLIGYLRQTERGTPASVTEGPRSGQQMPPFRMQPYEQLIHVLRAAGRESDARNIAIQKQVDLRKSGQLGLRARLWNLMLGFFVGHGYQPGRAALFALLVIAAGTYVFERAKQDGAMESTDRAVNTSASPSADPQFNPIVYSLDVFLPIIDLHQEDEWLPNNVAPTGRLEQLSEWLRIPGEWFYWTYTWLHISLGWILTTFIVAALTGLIKKD
jgi:hypothetical protein